MSRSIRRKFPATAPPKLRKRRGSDSSSSLDLSDDEGYSAVEDISDSEDDDEDDVNAVEEESILAEGLAKSSDAPRPPSDDDEENELDERSEEEHEEKEEDEEEEEEDDDDEEEEDEDDDDEHEDGQSVDADDGDIDDNASWAGIASDADESRASDFYQEILAASSDIAVERHVRFDVPDSDSDSTETEDDHADLFPDIFVSQNALDPAFRREIEHDPDESSGSGSFWDYHGQYEEDNSDSEAEEILRRLSDDEIAAATAATASQAAQKIADFTPAFEEPLELDGYETDGDTTDEEDVPEPIIHKRTRHPSINLSELSDSEVESPVKSQRGQPRVGRFKLDRSDKKPIAVLNPLTRKMMIFTPLRRRLDLSPEQFNIPWAIEEQSSPILSNSANMMLSAMFSSNTFGDFVNAQAMGPAEAFFPFPSEANVLDESSSSPSVHGEDDEDEEKLDISDFITWGEEANHSSGDEENNDDWEQSPPKRPTTANSEMDVLSHLTSDTVGAFRRNQINQQLILSNQATQDSLAFSGPYNYTALRGLRSDRFDTAGVPLTPIRRHKRQMSEATRSPLELLSAKRKASGEASSHQKRQRSISDVNFLRI